MLGSRRLDLRVDWFDPGDSLLVSATHHRGETGLVAFDCAVRLGRDHEPLVAGRVNVYIVDDWDALEAVADDED
jgi:predicted hotdog family 3-hydroxylacyl-ACP dehydratase